jgi:hypothetical protein
MKYIRCWILDGEYDPVVFQSLLKDMFGQRRMFDTPKRHVSESKFAVIASSISDATPFVLSNYNGPMPESQDLGMSRVPAS